MSLIFLRCPILEKDTVEESPGSYRCLPYTSDPSLAQHGETYTVLGSVFCQSAYSNSCLSVNTLASIADKLIKECNGTNPWIYLYFILFKSVTRLLRKMVVYKSHRSNMEMHPKFIWAPCAPSAFGLIYQGAIGQPRKTTSFSDPR
jgi:hypothetical protein